MKKTTDRSAARAAMPANAVFRRLGLTVMTLTAAAALTACNTKDNDPYVIPQNGAAA